jgi:AcrR family transcriptional regulator
MAGLLSYRTSLYSYITTFYSQCQAEKSGMMSVMSEAGMTAGRRARTPSADIERELLSAAEAVLVRDGPGALTVRAVAAEAGIALQGVYSRLGGKDGLVDALLIRGFARLTAALEAMREADPVERLRECGRRYRAFGLANPHFYAIMFEGAIPREHPAERPEVAAQAAAAFTALVRTVEFAAAAGAISAPEPTEVAQQLWNAVHGAVALELKGLILTPDPAATYEAAVDTIIRGLAPA